MKLYAVLGTIGGYAREDAPEANLVGIYTDPDVASQVSLAASGCRVEEITLDFIPPGYLKTAEAIGLPIGKKARP